MGKKNDIFPGFRNGNFVVIRILDQSENEIYGKTNKHTYCICRCDCDPQKDHIIYICDVSKFRYCNRLCKIKLLKTTMDGVYNAYMIRQAGSFIEKEVFLEMISSPCEFCGKDWSCQSRNVTLPNKSDIENSTFRRNELDRIDSKGPYIISNVRTLCHQCNMAKRLMSDQEFFDWIKRPYDK